MRKYALAVAAVLLVASVAVSGVLLGSPGNGGDTPDQGCHKVCSYHNWFQVPGPVYRGYSNTQADVAWTLSEAKGNAVRAIGMTTSATFPSGLSVCEIYGNPAVDHYETQVSGQATKWVPWALFECFHQ